MILTMCQKFVEIYVSDVDFKRSCPNCDTIGAKILVHVLKNAQKSFLDN